jgi:DNA-binding transcriptional ArsR family regulator
MEKGMEGKGRGTLKGADRLILGALTRHGPARFTDLQRLTFLGPSTLSRRLRVLEERGLVTGGDQIYRLSGEYDSPEWKTAWVVANLYSFIPLDPFEAFGILRGPAGEALRAISSLGLNLEGKIKSECPFHPPILICYREKGRMLDEMWGRLPGEREIHRWQLNEVTFLMGLGALNMELDALQRLERAWEHETFRLLLVAMLESAGLGDRKDEAIRLLWEGKDDWELFPALGVAKKLGALDGLLRLLRWVAPILDAHQERPDGPLVLDPERPTVSSIVFKDGATNHWWRRLCPLWRRRLGVKDAPD